MKNKKGFTLAELLVVVAIIAVLVAIAIPIFSTKLHDAKVATDWANLRTFYAEMKVEMIDSDDYSFLNDYKVLQSGNWLSGSVKLFTNATSLRNNNGSTVKLVGGHVAGNISTQPRLLFNLIYKCDKNGCNKHDANLIYGYYGTNHVGEPLFKDKMTWGS